jgi:hypothetical protein
VKRGFITTGRNAISPDHLHTESGKAPTFRMNGAVSVTDSILRVAKRDAEFEQQHGPVRSLWCQKHQAMRSQCGCVAEQIKV